MTYFSYVDMKTGSSLNLKCRVLNDIMLSLFLVFHGSYVMIK